MMNSVVGKNTHRALDINEFRAFAMADEWAPAYIADPWLIATAAVNSYTIITAEVSSGGLSAKTSNKNAKIPDVARAFRIKTNNLYYMMRKLGIKI